MMPSMPLTRNNRAPEMKGLKKSRTLQTDGDVAIFLYTVIKQLDLKHVDWNEVAEEMVISNGHAARMRYSRLRTQLEASRPRSNENNTDDKKASKGVKAPKDKKASEKPGQAKGKLGKGKGVDAFANKMKHAWEDDDKEPGDFIKNENFDAPISARATKRIKTEDSSLDEAALEHSYVGNIQVPTPIKSEPSTKREADDSHGDSTASATTEAEINPCVEPEAEPGVEPGVQPGVELVSVVKSEPISIKTQIVDDDDQFILPHAVTADNDTVQDLSISVQERPHHARDLISE